MLPEISGYPLQFKYIGGFFSCHPCIESTAVLSDIYIYIYIYTYIIIYIYAYIIWFS